MCGLHQNFIVKYTWEVADPGFPRGVPTSEDAPTYYYRPQQ